ncbi:MAG: bacterial Ig-like domain-containing protein, partial [Anaeroplasmataceae bacterium]|nr:bacterial Ig-like domain-containing protein [Anaeroplasmataceae bacterium]
VYSDETTKELDADEYVVDQSLVDLTKPNVYPLVVKYSEEYDKDGASEVVVVKNFVLITVNDPVSSLSFVEGTTEFEYGSIFSTDDWKVLVTYESGAIQTIDNKTFTFTTVDTFNSGDRTCRVTYKEMDVTKSITVTVKVLENPNADYHIAKSIVVGNLGPTEGAEIDSKRKQPLLNSEVDEFFTLSGNVLKYFNSDLVRVSGIEIAQGSSISFTIEGTAKLTLGVSSNGSSNTSLLSVTNAAGELQKQISSANETSEGLISILSSSSTTVVEFSLPAGTYMITFVSGKDDSANVSVPTDIPATRAGRFSLVQVSA